MDREKVPDVVRDAHDKLPHFEDGRIDYSNAELSPVVVLFLKYKDEILTLKRSDEVSTYPHRWGLVSGYLDELKSVMKKGLEEMEEETGIAMDHIHSMEEKGIYECQSSEEKKAYISFLFLVELKKKPKIKLSWEHEDYTWVKIGEAEKYLSQNALEELKMVLSK